MLSAIAIVGCSRKKDKFINRAWHSVGTEFNILYNGNLALENGRESLNSSYFDNYWEILPIERMQVTEDVFLPGDSKNQDFERAEEKAVKAIQKHSMNIQGKEKNPQIDEAYILLGQARYFDQRFIPAQEAFNHILSRYPTSDKINLAKIWREKTNLRLENDELAITNLKRLLKQENIEKQDLADATSTLAQAYINTKSLDSAITQLEIAANATKSNDERGRYLFIQGQLYNQLGKKDSANLAFDRIIELNRKTPRIYMISAHIEKAKNFDYENGNKLEFLELLTELEENRENRPYLDKIYHQIAEYHLTNGSDTIAVDYYNKSLRTNSQDKYLRAMNYQTLGNLSFDNALYKEAGSYYDSTMLNLERNTKLFREIRRKRENLDDVIYYEDIAQKNDSILSLVNMSDADRLVYFKDYTDKLKLKAEEEKEKAELASRNSGLINNSKNSGRSIGIKDKEDGAFYFYNPVTVAFGKNEFIKTWGERQLVDNWRWSDKTTTNISNEETDSDLASATEDELFDPQFYIDRIPTRETAIDTLKKDRNFAYYQLGLIYKDKFKEYTLAKDKLKTLLESNPEERLILPSKYNLYKIYNLLGLPGEAEIMKNNIISNHPDSRYAAILLNPESALAADENSPEFIYNALYKKFENEEYQLVIEQSDKHIITFDGEDIVPKFEFLKAVSKARLYGYESYKEAVNFIALNYPNSPEGKKAEEMMQNVMPMLANKDFVDDTAEKNFKVIYQFDVETPEEEINEFKKALDEAVKEVTYFNLYTSKDFYDGKKLFIVVHGLKSVEGALGFAEILEENEQTISKEYFGISSKNYQTIQIHKNLDEYLKSQQ
ncbi:tetratricopeptide repeat protein [Pontimicrobium sp. IMCC45349]|uniref:type IX secretion system periplasmic lipoprotein PorW/SprE n=1 Tax=Pontimicrobium sp. IMCC45349 TaxID=3391574 RepID=UPI00399EE947